MHSKNKLADALMYLGLMDMSLQARGGYYHDYLSPLATPELQLLADLQEAAMKFSFPRRRDIMLLRQRVIDGEFDATADESDEWVQSEDGQAAFARLAEKLAEGHPKEMLGDAPIESAYYDQMNALAGFLDEQFDGDAKGKDKKVGFVLMLFEYGDNPGRCNYISNGAGRQDVVNLMKEMIARFEGQPEQSGKA